jgi:hypothetical protein
MKSVESFDERGACCAETFSDVLSFFSEIIVRLSCDRLMNGLWARKIYVILHEFCKDRCTPMGKEFEMSWEN